MNESELNNRTSKSETYHATTNLNIDIENPQINMNSVVGVNIRDVEPNYSSDQNIDINNNNDSFASFNNGSYNQVSDFSNNYNNSFSTSVSEPSQSEIMNNQYITGDLNSDIGKFNEPISEVPSNEKIVYEPTMKEKKKKSQGFSIPIEVKVTFFIVLVLIIFVLLMPYIYDFFKNLQLALTR